MAVKTYVLLENMDADAPVYRQMADGKREQIKKIPFHRPTLRQEFQDKDGNGHVIRYKQASKFIDQAEQMEKEKLDANLPFTTVERRDCEFRHGILVTPKLRAQEYLEAHPEFQGFEGYCDTVREPKYRLLNEAVDAKLKNTETKKRIQAASKVFDLGLKQAQEMLTRLNGSFFETPNTIEECQNMLITFIDDSEEAGLDAVLKVKNNDDEEATILIGSLLRKEKLSFNVKEGQVSKKDVNGKWIDVKEIVADTLEERKRLFIQYILSDNGNSLLNDLVDEDLLEEIEAPSPNKSKGAANAK